MSAITRNDHAVSPVIGVMLMIVVTIIIAAIVSAFSGNIGTDEHKTPVATLEIDPNTACNGTVEFHAKGGSELEIDNIAVELEYDGRTITLSNSDSMTGPSLSGVSTTGCTTGGTIPYISESGGGSEGYISAGDRFVLTADKNDATNKNFMFRTSTMGALNNLTIPYNAHVKYIVLDKTSSKAIQTGEFILR